VGRGAPRARPHQAGHEGQAHCGVLEAPHRPKVQLQATAQEDGGQRPRPHLDAPLGGEGGGGVPGDVAHQHARAQHAHHARQAQLPGHPSANLRRRPQQQRGPGGVARQERLPHGEEEHCKPGRKARGWGGAGAGGGGGRPPPAPRPGERQKQLGASMRGRQLTAAWYPP
jgi:hypothetical protein